MRALLPLVPLLAACSTTQAPGRPPSSAPFAPAEPSSGDDDRPALVAEGHPPEQARPQARRSTAATLERFRRGVASVAFDVQVHPPGTTEIAGFVLSRDGKPVHRACVELAGKTRPTPVFTSNQGDFRFSGVPPGTARVTITVENIDDLLTKRIADHHDQDPDLTVLVRPLVLSPATGRLTVPRVKRAGGLPGQDESVHWIEVAPLALDHDGYSPACRQALRRRPR